MAVNTQQLNSITVLLDKVKAIKTAYFDLIEAKEVFNLIGLPPGGDFPLADPQTAQQIVAMTYLTRGKLERIPFMVDALITWMNTAIDLDGPGGSPAKKPLDAIVEVLPGA